MIAGFSLDDVPEVLPRRPRHEAPLSSVLARAEVRYSPYGESTLSSKDVRRMNDSGELDSVDKALLRELQNDARQTNKALAALTGDLLRILARVLLSWIDPGGRSSIGHHEDSVLTIRIAAPASRCSTRSPRAPKKRKSSAPS